MKSKKLQFGAITLALMVCGLATNANAAPMSGIADLASAVEAPPPVQKVQYWNGEHYYGRHGYWDNEYDYDRYPRRRSYYGSSYGYTYGEDNYRERCGHGYSYGYRCHCRCNTYYHDHDCD